MKHLPLPVGEILEQSRSEDAEIPDFTLPEKNETTAEVSGDADLQAFRQALLDDAQDKGCLTGDVRALIEEGLIISPDQIGKDNRFATRTSVSGFDYNAKVSALRRMLKNGSSLLELELTDGSVVAAPLELLKDSSRREILRVRILPEGTERSIPVSSVFRITELRWSLG